MKKNDSAVLACVGAVIGAGFASGRETIVFFTQYGAHAWWLIFLSTFTMAALCALCIRSAQKENCGANWCLLVRGKWLARACSLLLLVITAGAMVSASGHMIALLWYHPGAYAIGALGTLWLAWGLGYGSLRPLSAISAVLSLALLCALMAALIRHPGEAVLLAQPPDARSLASAAIRAVGYAGMNMMLAMGVVCRSAAHVRNSSVTAGLFGWMIGMLLLLSHCVYSRYQASHASDFPIIVLLSDDGARGYLFGALLLYLSILTTLTSVIYALRSAVALYVPRRNVQTLLVLGLPLAVSGFGFAKIVDRFYAPAGLLCMAIVFLPLAVTQWKMERRRTLS